MCFFGLMSTWGSEDLRSPLCRVDGVPTVIGDAGDPGAAIKAVTGEEAGTWIAPRENRLPARKLWIAARGRRC